MRNLLRTKPMKTTVHAIQSIEGTKEFIVLISIGIQQEQFTFTVEKANQEEFAVVGGDDRFCKFFRFTLLHQPHIEAVLA